MASPPAAFGFSAARPSAAAGLAGFSWALASPAAGLAGLSGPLVSPEAALAGIPAAGLGVTLVSPAAGRAGRGLRGARGFLGAAVAATAVAGALAGSLAGAASPGTPRRQKIPLLTQMVMPHLEHSIRYGGSPGGSTAATGRRQLEQ